jgi:hypothetical protein
MSLAAKHPEVARRSNLFCKVHCVVEYLSTGFSL